MTSSGSRHDQFDHGERLNRSGTSDRVSARLVSGPFSLIENGTTRDGIRYTFHYAMPYGATLRWQGGPEGVVPRSIRQAFELHVQISELPVDTDAIEVLVEKRQISAPYRWR